MLQRNAEDLVDRLRASSLVGIRLQSWQEIGLAEDGHFIFKWLYHLAFYCLKAVHMKRINLLQLICSLAL